MFEIKWITSLSPPLFACFGSGMNSGHITTPTLDGTEQITYAGNYTIRTAPAGTSRAGVLRFGGYPTGIASGVARVAKGIDGVNPSSATSFGPRPHVSPIAGGGHLNSRHMMAPPVPNSSKFSLARLTLLNFGATSRSEGRQRLHPHHAPGRAGHPLNEEKHMDHPFRRLPGDPSGFWADQDLVFDLRKEGSDLSERAAATIAWLREEMIDPMEYMRVSNERGAAFMALCALKEKKAA